MNNDIKNLPQGISDILIPSIPSLTSCITSCIQYAQSQQTQRSLIEAKKDEAISMITEKRDVIMHYLNQRFGERKYLYEKYFDLVDKALESGNAEIEKIALQSILSLYASPCYDGIDCITEKIERSKRIKE
ncbi:MAG: hypothetical protein ACRC5H_06265 [Treponemataceae bacterium]